MSSRLTWTVFVNILKELTKLGPLGVFKKINTFHTIKPGKLVGTDKYGNKYFESTQCVYGQNRWIEYVSREYDATQVPPEWHSWLHYSNELPGEQVQRSFQPQYSRNHIGNRTATEDAYFPPNFILNSRWKPKPKSTIPTLPDDFDFKSLKKKKD